MARDKRKEVVEDPPSLDLRTGGSLEPYNEGPGCLWWVGLFAWLLFVGGIVTAVLRGAVKSLGWKGVW